MTPEHSYELFNAGEPGKIGQGPYKSPSVFNFYRPGYVAPGTETGAAGMTVPELQIVNASSVANYANYMTYFIFGFAEDWFENQPLRRNTMIPDYSEELALAEDPLALVQHLDDLLAYGRMSDDDVATLAAFIGDIPLTNQYVDDYDGADLRVKMAVLLVMTSPDYLVQR